MDHTALDSDALFVISQLKNAGYQAYLVGGSVRDILAKKKPKDFDISTSARPEEVKKVFRRNCLLIGRRFRLAHVRFGKKVIEVATFRSGDNDSDLIVQDNVYGSPGEDAQRRDFTINGLFYDPIESCIIDYVGGWSDIHKKVLRSIGDPAIRFRQDPVRMIRLIKFKARFGFEIDETAFHAMIECREEIFKSAPARLLEEFLRMLESGSSYEFIRLMQHFEFNELLFPALSHFLKSSHGVEIYTFLKCADRIQNEFGITHIHRSILLSCCLFPILEKEIHSQYLEKGLMPQFSDIIQLTYSLLKGFESTSFVHLPKRLTQIMAFILFTQYRLTPLTGKFAYRHKLMRNKEFILALKFLEMRALINPKLQEAAKNWKKAYRQDDHRGARSSHPHPPPVNQQQG